MVRVTHVMRIFIPTPCPAGVPRVTLTHLMGPCRASSSAVSHGVRLQDRGQRWVPRGCVAGRGSALCPLGVGMQDVGQRSVPMGSAWGLGFSVGILVDLSDTTVHVFLGWTNKESPPLPPCFQGPAPRHLPLLACRSLLCALGPEFIGGAWQALSAVRLSAVPGGHAGVLRCSGWFPRGSFS